MVFHLEAFGHQSIKVSRATFYVEHFLATHTFKVMMIGAVCQLKTLWSIWQFHADEFVITHPYLKVAINGRDANPQITKGCPHIFRTQWTDRVLNYVSNPLSVFGVALHQR